MSTDGFSDERVDRRTAIKKAAVGAAAAGVVWSAPRVEGLSLRPSYAAATSGGTANHMIVLNASASNMVPAAGGDLSGIAYNVNARAVPRNNDSFFKSASFTQVELNTNLLRIKSCSFGGGGTLANMNNRNCSYEGTSDGAAAFTFPATWNVTIECV